MSTNDITLRGPYRLLSKVEKTRMAHQRMSRLMTGGTGVTSTPHISQYRNRVPLLRHPPQPEAFAGSPGVLKD